MLRRRLEAWKMWECGARRVLKNWGSRLSARRVAIWTRMKADAAFVDEIPCIRFEECVDCRGIFFAESLQPVIDVGFDARAAYEEGGAVDADGGGHIWGAGK
jgi:hypothetical protein